MQTLKATLTTFLSRFCLEIPPFKSKAFYNSIWNLVPFQMVTRDHVNACNFSMCSDLKNAPYLEFILIAASDQTTEKRKGMTAVFNINLRFTSCFSIF